MKLIFRGIRGLYRQLFYADYTLVLYGVIIIHYIRFVYYNKHRL